MTEATDVPVPARVKLFVLAPGARPGEPGSFVPSQRMPVEGLLSTTRHDGGAEDLFLSTAGGDTLLVLRSAQHAGIEASDLGVYGQSGVTIPPDPTKSASEPIVEGQTVAWLVTVLREH